MPIQYIRGDLLASGADILTIPVNCRGVAGKGLALQCKQRYPYWFETYKLLCEQGQLSLGRPALQLGRGWYFVSFPTKDDWRFPSRLEYIHAGLQYLLTATGPWVLPYKVMAFPQLGCGVGGLSWSDVQPVMEYYLSQLRCTSLIYVN